MSCFSRSTKNLNKKLFDLTFEIIINKIESKEIGSVDYE